MPRSQQIVSGMSDLSAESLRGEGFAIHAFQPDGPAFFIPATKPATDADMERAFHSNMTGNIYPFPAGSTPQEVHAAEVEHIRGLECTGTLRKAVAARCEVSAADSLAPADEDICDAQGHEIDINRTFRKLCTLYPDAFVFLFSTPETGTWAGATPELLLRSCGGRIESMALAGTRTPDDQEGWDAKNLEEHQVVTEYIADAFRKAGLAPMTEGPHTLHAGPVEHLMTRISAQLPENTDAAPLIAALSPTPALCGDPRPAALETITECEDFVRAFYGGYCGPVAGNGDFSLFVTLRCGWLEPKRYCLMAGGGIMPGSVAADEWRETVRKAATFAQAICIKEYNNNQNINITTAK